MTSIGTPLRCLLIGPLGFYSFHSTLAEGLKKRGYEVDMLNEEFPANSFGKVLGKLTLPVLRHFTLRGLKKRLASRDPYDLVLIVKGRGLSPKALIYLRSKAKRIVGYNFDSFQYNPSPRDWYYLTDHYATFDIDDAAATVGLPLVHLFSAVAAQPQESRLYDLSIVQRVHSDRLAYADLALRGLPKGSRSFVFLFESNLLSFALGLLRHPLLYLRLRRYISFKPLSYSHAMAAIGASRVTLDYSHPRQSGITVRCFEAQSLDVAILTNNRAAVDCGLFAPGSIAYLPRETSPAIITTLLAELDGKRQQRCKRTLDDFLDDLLAETKPCKVPLAMNPGHSA